MNTDKPKSHAEKVWEEEQEFLKNNQEEVIIKVDKAKKFRSENGYSLTMSKLMEKWGCKTVEEYREVRRKHCKENYIGPKKEKKKVETTETSFARRDNYNGVNYKNNNRNNIGRNAGRS